MKRGSIPRTGAIFKESIMKKKNTPQPRNYLVKLAMFRKAGSHRKSNKAIRRLEKSKKVYPIIDILINSVYNRIHSGLSIMDNTAAF